MAEFDLVLAMRRATRRAHNIANALILSKLVVVLTEPQLYAQALGSFLPVYAELAHQLEAARKARGGAAAGGALARVADAAAAIPSRAAAMEGDLRYFLGPGWRGRLRPSPAAAAYAAHLRALASSEPALLIPYAFSLHVPVLLGFMGKRVQAGLRLPDASAGLAFFDVPDKAVKLAALRAAVSEAGRAIDDPQLRQRVVDEAVTQFRLNNAVVAEFQLGHRAVLAAASRALAALPPPAKAALGLVGAAGAWFSSGPLLQLLSVLLLVGAVLSAALAAGARVKAG